MKSFLLLLLCACSLLASHAQPSAADAAADVDFDTWFLPRSLRIDFALSGNARGQQAAIRTLRDEPVWAGPRRHLIDPFGYGGYYVQVYDKTGTRLLYSRGFNTLFEEWLTTAQARSETQSWDNSISVPYPRDTVVIQLSARSRADMQFHPLLRQTVAPSSIFIDRTPLQSHPVTVLQENGPADRCVDLVFLAEGYTAAQQEQFVSDARRFMEALFSTSPFDQCRSLWNVRAVGTISREEGTSSCGRGIYRHTALGAGYYTFGVDRYLTTPRYNLIRDAVWDVPCDAIFILINADTYGGGGMYNHYACGTAHNDRTPVVFTHEFGHSFAGLADEYFTSAVAYEDFYNLAFEPWEPNITTLVHFASKWADLLPPSTPVPTPLAPDAPQAIGVYEGGGYLAHGIYRPMDHCMMRDYAPFCPACSRAILRMVHYYADRPL